MSPCRTEKPSPLSGQGLSTRGPERGGGGAVLITIFPVSQCHLTRHWIAPAVMVTGISVGALPVTTLTCSHRGAARCASPTVRLVGVGKAVGNGTPVVTGGASSSSSESLPFPDTATAERRTTTSTRTGSEGGD